MNGIRLRIGVLLPAVAVSAMLSGCSGTETGGVAEKDTASPGVSSPRSTPSGPAGSNSSGEIDSIAPCSLLSTGELGKYDDFEKGEPEVVGTGRNCTWSEVRASASEEGVLLVNVTIRGNAGIDTVRDLGGGLKTGVTQNSGRKVVQTTSDSGCLVAMAVGQGARVEVLAGSIDNGPACDMTNELVEVIDPKLPEG